MKFAVAIDIGGTNTRVALVDETYSIVSRAQFSTYINSPDNTLDKISEIISSFKENIIGVGMSCPGPLDLIHEKILTPPNLFGKWHNYDTIHFEYRPELIIYNKIKDFKKRYPLTISWRLKAHSKVAAEHVNDDEEVLYAFAAQKLPSVFNITSTYVIVITDKRILLAQKRLIFGYFY